MSDITVEEAIATLSALREKYGSLTRDADDLHKLTRDLYQKMWSPILEIFDHLDEAWLRFGRETDE